MNEPALKKPTDWDELYPGRFLKAGLLKGRKVTLTVTSVDIEKLATDDGAKVKGIVSFKETPMALPLNKTNGICLREMFGKTLANWEGKKVTIFADTWNGEPCIRIWGSPDIPTDMRVIVSLPRKKPTPMMLHHVAKPRAQAAQDPDQESELSNGDDQ